MDTEDERQAHIEQQIAAWMRIGYQRHQLITLANGTVIADTDQHTLEAVLDALAGDADEH